MKTYLSTGSQAPNRDKQEGNKRKRAINTDISDNYFYQESFIEYDFSFQKIPLRFSGNRSSIQKENDSLPRKREKQKLIHIFVLFNKNYQDLILLWRGLFTNVGAN